MSKRFVVCVAIWAAVLASFPLPAAAQFGRGGAEWMTSGSDAQRSFSIPTDPKISAEGMGKPGFEFLWKLKLNNEAVQLNSLTPAILMDRYIGYRGFRSFAFVAGSSNTVFAIDSDLARIEWQVHLSGAPSPAPGSLTCPGGLTAAIARATTASYPVPGAGGGGLGGRGGPARSGVGAPSEGAITIGPAIAAAAAAAAGPGRGPQFRQAAVIYAISSDGALHGLYLSNGHEPAPPVKFLPANSSAQGLTLVDNIAYAATGACGGNQSGVWAVDISSNEVKQWHPSAGAVAGSAGPAFGPDGTVYVSTTAGELAALDPKTLSVKASYKAAGQEFSSSPVVFAYKEKNYLATATKDGRIYLFDESLRTPLSTTQPISSDFTPASVATFQANDTRWLLTAGSGAPSVSSGFQIFNGTVTKGAVAAWKLSEVNGSLTLQPAWVSRDLTSPLTPMVINGVVFAVSSGEYRTADATISAAQRAQRSVPAVLYALDLNTGKSVWDSGNTITSFVHSGSLSGGASQLYIETWDHHIYAFGYAIEH